jgi:geranylgeranyl pyrophosphate synthase
MIGGQYVDITVDASLDVQELAALHRLKTGRLLGACVRTALEVARVPDLARSPWHAFADEVGLLFQIVDDVLDATGTAEELGKTPGKDAAAGKVTYVTLLGIERARQIADETRARVQAILDGVDGETRVLRELVDTIRERRT